MFQAIPEHIEKLPMSIFFLADVEALVHGIACVALFFFFMAGCLFGFADLRVRAKKFVSFLLPSQLDAL